ncbi:beta-propeller domain-containing protein [Candidatus Woesearchaeota archaeon]|nr:beta-propeller domain-containing protein [Candidatus Woesearchaeota archaeon]
MAKIAKFGFFMVLIFIVAVAGCTKAPVQKPADKAAETGLQADDSMKQFSSAKEVIEFLEKNQVSGNFYGGFNGGIMMRQTAVMEAAMDSGAKIAAPSAAPSAGADDYSQTNVQVGGVDEADFVKNDGKYIYTLSGNKLVIVNAYPAEDAEILSETEIKGRPRDMFVSGDKLVVMVEGDDQVLGISEYDFVPRPRYAQKTHAFVFDISDRENPAVEKDFDVSGYYYESRMIGNYVYFIAKESVYYFSNYVDMPAVREGGKVIASPSVFYFPRPFSSYSFHTIAALNLQDMEINAESFMLGESSTLYVSENNMYIAYQNNPPYTYYETHNRDRFFEVVLPLLPSDTRNNINAINNDDSLDQYEKWQQISRTLEGMYNSMNENEKERLVERIQGAVEDYELKLEQERRKTIIHRISVNKGEIEHEADGEVPGYLLNQFSMDEKNGNLRVATTTYVYARESTMYNNVFVLDSDMDVIGKLEDIAPEERIYSARFIGDRLYMVTFKNVDPFFVIGLSDPSNPEILGKLKIPGFSNYLHPYDENTIIGIGKETEGNEWGGVSTRGVKLALFDVSDVSNPKQLNKYEIGEQGSDSEALNDHKAFLFDKEKNILVIPVREVKGRYYDSKYGYYRNNVWQGAYAFGLSREGGFELKGKITHSENVNDNYYYGGPDAVRRALFMDDVLYTISSKKIMMNDIGSIETINEIKLPYEEIRDYPVPMPLEGVMVR